MSLGSQSVCVGHGVWPLLVQTQDPRHSCEGRTTRASVHLVKPGTCFWVWDHVFSRPLMGGVTLLSGGPLGEAPGSGAGDAQLLIRNLWHHWGTQEEPLLLQGA